MLPLASSISPRGADWAAAKKCCRLARALPLVAVDDLHLGGARHQRQREEDEERVNDRDAVWGFHRVARGRIITCFSVGMCMPSLCSTAAPSVCRVDAARISPSRRALSPSSSARRRVELRQALRFTDADRAAPDDGKRDEHESGENDPHHGPSAHGYAALCHARSRALRERGLSAVSSGLAVRARLVSSSPSAFPRQVQWGCFGGQMHAWLHSRIVCLASRSSPGVVRDDREPTPRLQLVAEEGQRSLERLQLVVHGDAKRLEEARKITRPHPCPEGAPDRIDEVVTHVHGFAVAATHDFPSKAIGARLVSVVA